MQSNRIVCGERLAAQTRDLGAWVLIQIVTGMSIGEVNKLTKLLKQNI